MARPRTADDFAAVRTRMDELRLERDQALAGQIWHLNLGYFDRNPVLSDVASTRTSPQVEEAVAPTGAVTMAAHVLAIAGPYRTPPLVLIQRRVKHNRAPSQPGKCPKRSGHDRSDWFIKITGEGR